jgi:hypothetical protein
MLPLDEEKFENLPIEEVKESIPENTIQQEREI